MSTHAGATVTHVRVLEGPNLYFTRPAVLLTLSVPGYLAAERDVLVDVARGLGVRRSEPGRPGTEARQRFVLRVVERAVRSVAAGAGSARLGVRARAGAAPEELLVAVAVRNRGRAVALGEELGPLLATLLAGEDTHDAVASAAGRVRATPVGDVLRPLRPRIPTVCVTGTNGKTTTTRLIAHLAMTAGRRTGWSSTDGVLIQGELVEYGDFSGPAGARTVLADKGMEFAVLETARGGMLLKGLGTAYNHVSVVTNVSADHLGVNGIDTLDQLAEVKAIITRVTRPDGWVVLNGDDPRVWAMRGAAGGRPWCFTLSPDAPALREAIDAGGRGITVLDGQLTVLAPGHSPVRLLPVTDVPVTLAGLSEHNVANALAAAAAGLAAGLPHDAVVEGLRTFLPDAEHNAGRMNVYSLPIDGGEVTFIVDMAHNEAGLEALLRVARGLKPPGSQVLLGLGTGGDRTDEILVNLGELAGLGADRVYIEHKEHYLRGRTMAGLETKLREGLSRVGVTPVASSETELEGLVALLGDARDGDVLAEMVHSHQALVHTWLLEHGGRVDDPAAIARKVGAANGRHEADDRIAALWAMDDDVRRIAAAHALARDFPDDGRVLYELAGTYDSAGREEEAVARYDEALARPLREPFHRRALIQKGSTLRHLGRLEESLAIFDQLAADWPDNPAVVAFRAFTLHDLGRDPEALRTALEHLIAASADPDVQRYPGSLARFTAAIADDRPDLPVEG
ncbi:tetratricopeptide repeat protein [Allobranchiibius huperziae]|uniref:Cyanophycin synthetase n=1 Tax=Allobranchiibius huperziae TaxID=1874116 RepID=A0A853DCV6_9MICO|nr:cyanophycin synthetase [Allobranchiibius huperziae]